MNITEDLNNMSKKLDNKELKNILKPYGNYDSKFKTLFLYSNDSLNDLDFLTIMNNNKFFIQANLL